MPEGGENLPTETEQPDRPGDNGDEPFRAETLRQLEALTEPQAERDFTAVLSRYLDRPDGVSSETYRALREAVGTLDGEQALAFLSWLAHQNPEDRAPEAEELGLSEAAHRIALRLVALFGPEIEHASDITGMSPEHDWQAIRRYTTRDVRSGRYTIRFDILKSNREVATIEGELDSILRLMQRLMLGILDVDDPDAFDREDVDDFVAEVDKLRKRVEVKAPPHDAPQS